MHHMVPIVVNGIIIKGDSFYVFFYTMVYTTQRCELTDQSL